MANTKEKRQQKIEFDFIERIGMRKNFFAILLNFALWLSSCATADIRKCPEIEKAPHVNGQLFIVFVKGTEEVRINEINKILNVTVIKKNLGGRIILVNIPKGSSIEIICQAYFTYPEVKAVNLNYTGIRPL